MIEYVDGVPFKGPLPAEKAIDYAGQRYANPCRATSVGVRNFLVVLLHLIVTVMRAWRDPASFAAWSLNLS